MLRGWDRPTRQHRLHAMFPWATGGPDQLGRGFRERAARHLGTSSRAAHEGLSSVQRPCNAAAPGGNSPITLSFRADS